MGLLNDVKEQEGLIFHNSDYNWNNIQPEKTPSVPTPPQSIQPIPPQPVQPQSEEYVVQDNRGTFEDVTPQIDTASAVEVLEKFKASGKKLTDNQFNEVMKAVMPTKEAETTKEEPQSNLYESARTGLNGINQFFHGVIDKEFSGGFMGFNPMNSMAHSAIGDHMRMYDNPDNITDEMIANTKAMIIEKAGSQLGQQKTAYILERFGQYVQQIKAYQNAKSGDGLLPNVVPKSVLDMVR